MGDVTEFKPKVPPEPEQELYTLSCDDDHMLFLINSDGSFVCPICDQEILLVDLVEERFFS